MAGKTAERARPRPVDHFDFQDICALLLGISFTIVNNDSPDAVSGTFNGLADGSELTIGAATLTISYAGGTGNDVVQIGRASCRDRV